MTDDQFQILRQELAAFRGETEGRFGSLGAEVASFRREMDSFRGEMDRRFVEMDRRFDAIDSRFAGVEDRLKRVEEIVIRLDERVGEKPDKALVYQAVFTVNASFVAILGLAFILYHTFAVT